MARLLEELEDEDEAEWMRFVYAILKRRADTHLLLVLERQDSPPGSLAKAVQNGRAIKGQMSLRIKFYQAMNEM